MSELEPPHEVLLIGLGAVGGVYAYILEQSKRCRVTAIARSAFDSIQDHGLTIRSQKFGVIPNWKPYRVLRKAEDANDRNYRLIICTFKCLPDLLPTTTILAPFLVPFSGSSLIEKPKSKAPTVVLIQNGIGIEQPIAEAFPSIHIISTVAWIGANLISKPNQPTIIEHGKMEKLVFGLYDGEGFGPSVLNDPDPGESGHFVDGLLKEDGSSLEGTMRDEKRALGKVEVDLFASLLKDGGGQIEVLEHIQPARWAKNLWNAAFSTMCSLSRSPVSALIAPEVLPHTLPVVRRTMLEIIYVARALGYREIDLPAKAVDDTIQLTISHYQGSKSQNNEDVFEEDEEDEAEEGTEGTKHITFKPSMLIDLENGRPMELEPIVGAVLDRARAKAIETPRLDLFEYPSLRLMIYF
ncbi:ketopantoate reductase PanE/ApbA C terminal-domain-containing protein [Melampsora americana]|nr:ketopantoate reductase PanE/ApbA C terminal-domain-containing protein [Melampsora americana]